MKPPDPPLKSLSAPTPLGEQPSRRKIRYLAQSVALEETGNPFLAQWVIGTVSLIVLAFTLWMAVTRIDEVAVTMGKVVPIGQVQMVQHSDGGVVEAILVREGDKVAVGQPLVRLDATSLKIELQEKSLREASLNFQAQRLMAFANNKPLKFVKHDQSYESLALDQEKVYQAQTLARNEKIEVLLSRIQQRKNDIEVLDEQEKTLKVKLSSLSEEFSLRKKLTERGLSSRMRFLESQRELNQTQGELAQIISKKKQTHDILDESQINLRELKAQLVNQALTEMSLVRSELIQVQEALKKLVNQVRGTEITAKVAGVVQKLNVNSLGGVVSPRSVLLEIVPLDRELIVESRISSRDIGHVQVNQPVSVKFTAYDFSRYGGVSGRLKKISTSTFLDEHGEPYYKGVISLDLTYVGPDPNLRPILPGMTVQSSIQTGDKTVMEYLLKPIYTSVKQALQER